MKKIFLLIIAAVFAVSASDKTPQQAYIEKYADIAVREMYRTGVPASITLAQGMVESGCGRSSLATEGNNHFGIKCHNGWTGKTIYKDDDTRNECFRAYRSAEQSFQDHSDFLRYRDRYSFLFSYEVTDYKSWAYGLKKAGYATDPAYAKKLIKTIEDNNLWKYDTVKLEDREDTMVIPGTPQQLEAVTVINQDTCDEKYNFSLCRPIYEKNGVPFVYSADGETYASIAASFRLFRKELLRFNDLKDSEPLAPGTIVYLQAKKNKAAKGLDKIIVDEDNITLRSICQRFAVKESAVRRLNSLPADYVPKEGDTILLRKQKKSK